MGPLVADFRAKSCVIFFGFFAVACAKPETLQYVDSARCATCHPEIDETYKQTGMARSFFRPSPENTVEDYTANNTFFHAASDRYYTMTARDGHYSQRRYQIDDRKQQANVIEEQVDYVIGSGNHARTYLHLTEQNKLVEMPLSWYAEDGGHWGMSPGYDWRGHSGFRRKITLECMFCHNAYPEGASDSDRADMEAVFPAGKIPEGIDCQRCHGPGSAHVESPEAGNIVNPAALPRDRNLEVCMQCHLETTSAPLPYAVRLFDRGVFSYRPGEPLSEYMIHFDSAQRAGLDDRFEIASSVYGLRKSRCFQASAMTCTTCHDPHDIPRGESAVQHYVKVCKSCHEDGIRKLVAAKGHPASEDCLGCHMPKRRTQDVVHAVMTDHYIKRTVEPGLLAPLSERHGADEDIYKGEVVPYYPSPLHDTTENDLYVAVAQVTAKADLPNGIRKLRAVIDRTQPQSGGFYFELAKAYAEVNAFDQAIPMYRKTLERWPDYWPALHRLGLALSRVGKIDEAVGFIERASTRTTDGTVLNDLALLYRRQGRTAEAIAALQKAAARDDSLPHVYNNLAGMLQETGDIAGAERAFRDAIRVQPDLMAAHFNLGLLLLGEGKRDEAIGHFQTVIRGGDLNLRKLAADAMGRIPPP
jgi:predicted CXXCH cytochrome family protein